MAYWPSPDDTFEYRPLSNDSTPSPRQINRKLWTVYETVPCMQQLCEHYASQTCSLQFDANAMALNYAQSQAPVSSTFTDLAR